MIIIVLITKLTPTIIYPSRLFITMAQNATVEY